MGIRKIAVLATGVALTVVALLAPVSAKADFIYDLTVSDSWIGSGSITFDTLSGGTPSGVSAFSFHTSTGFGSPQDYDLADIASVSWSIDGLFNLSLLLSTTPIPFGSGQSSILLTNQPGNHSLTCGDIIFGAPGSFICADLPEVTSLTYGGVLSTSLVPISVPEPGTLALFAAGLAGLGWMTRRRQTD